MVFSLAPKVSSSSRFHSSSTAVRIREIKICRLKQPPRVFSALSLLPWPIKMEARGAPPEPTSAEKAETIRMMGRQTPMPVRASLPSPGMCPI